MIKLVKPKQRQCGQRDTLLWNTLQSQLRSRWRGSTDVFHDHIESRDSVRRNEEELVAIRFLRQGIDISHFTLCQQLQLGQLRLQNLEFQVHDYAS